MKTKTAILIFVILLTASGCTYYAECTDNAYDYEITVTIDRTGSHSISMPERSTIQQAFPPNRDLWKGYLFRLASLSDVDLNIIYEAKIKPECSIAGNVYDRKKQMEKFNEELDSAISNLLSEPVGTPSSSIYIPITKELSRLAGSKARNKRLIIFSDLLEETSLLEFDRKKTLAQLKQNPDSIAGILSMEAELPPLDGIEIYIVYRPVNSDDSDRHRIISRFYKNLFEKNGAKVFIGANLIQ